MQWLRSKCELRKRNEEVKLNLKVKGRKYGHLHVMASNITTVIVIISESFQKKDQEASDKTRMNIWNKYKDEITPKLITLN